MHVGDTLPQVRRPSGVSSAYDRPRSDIPRMDSAPHALRGRRRSAGCGGATADAAAGTDNIIATVNLTSDEPDANTGDNVCDVDLGTADLQCTLRAAIQQANAYPGTDADLIWFAIPGGGVHRIAPTTPLPDVAGKVTIDGYTQPGSSVNTESIGHGDNAELRIELSGRKLDPTLPPLGLTFLAGSAGSRVRGLAINQFYGGIEVRASILIDGNFIGTDAAGERDRGNTYLGIFSTTGTVTVGGADPANANVISGNNAAAIGTNSKTVAAGNYIGTASDGKSPLPNSMLGAAAVGLNGTGNVVGGIGNSANVIAFNDGPGIALFNSGLGSLFTRNRIFGNGGLAIDLNGDGRTPNDADDSDTGPNSLLNFPVLNRATTRQDHTTIRGVYEGYPAAAPYRIEFFENPPHTRQARRFLGQLQIQTETDGTYRFRFDEPV